MAANGDLVNRNFTNAMLVTGRVGANGCRMLAYLVWNIFFKIIKQLWLLLSILKFC